ncbi:lymphokine-activated killer T-cell-originated protein kinase [Rhagoletis pomonella]|uniref:lymphokine-activated killer T-cell-originated protein kinase n=1 Tax=Rhagoletis pomonella TaxID=28610 RepID=UPI00177DE9A6|nr:lymphokine-activated killer T-cell-originated protein kinase [Rhagoletis pomonella]
METPRRVTRNMHMQNIQKISTPLRIPPSPFMKNLGYGTGVNVYRLERSPKCGQMRSPWAVKRISKRANEHAELFNSRIHDEAEILRKLSHPNIVGFRGAIKSDDGLETLALECCKTSLGTILEDRNEENLGPLPAKYTLKMIADIAHALDYLHTKAKILHGDLKSFNVLVKGDFEICKLCDFGVSLPLDEYGLINFAKNPHLRYVGTNLWSAPEVMDDSEIIDFKADIFSFGLIIYETVSLVPPHTLDTVDDENDEANNTVESSKTSDSCDKSCATAGSEDYELEPVDRACGTRPPLPQAFHLTDDYNRIIEFFYCCTNELPEDRPPAKIIWSSLENESSDNNGNEKMKSSTK